MHHSAPVQAPDPHCLLLARSDWVPNHPRLPVLHYRGVLGDGDRASGFERLYGGHGWKPDCATAFTPFDHYHSTAHEVLGIVAGTAR